MLNIPVYKDRINEKKVEVPVYKDRINEKRLSFSDMEFVDNELSKLNIQGSNIEKFIQLVQYWNESNMKESEDEQQGIQPIESMLEIINDETGIKYYFDLNQTFNIMFNRNVFSNFNTSEEITLTYYTIDAKFMTLSNSELERIWFLEQYMNYTNHQAWEKMRLSDGKRHSEQEEKEIFEANWRSFSSSQPFINKYIVSFETPLLYEDLRWHNDYLSYCDGKNNKTCYRIIEENEPRCWYWKRPFAGECYWKRDNYYHKNTVPHNQIKPLEYKTYPYFNIKKYKIIEQFKIKKCVLFSVYRKLFPLISSFKESDYIQFTTQPPNVSPQNSTLFTFDFIGSHDEDFNFDDNVILGNISSFIDELKRIKGHNYKPYFEEYCCP